MDENYTQESLFSGWLRRFFLLLGIFAVLGLCVAAPLSGLWLYLSGDLAVERAADAQSKRFALFGSGLCRTPADVLEYKTALYERVKPDVVLVGSAGMGSVRGDVFSRPMLNMTGTADSLAELRASLDAMLVRHTPSVVLVAVDFWWFSTAWEPDPFVQTRSPASSSYGYSMDALRLPWQALLSGEMGLPQFLFLSFSKDRYGMRAQFRDSGYGPDGSLYATDVLTSAGARDAGFARTLERQRRHIGEFAPQSEISAVHLDAFADIYFRLRGRGIVPVVFLSPLSGPLVDALKAEEALYPHLFKLRQALQDRGIRLADTTDPRYLESTGCEFLDGTHAGEVAALRVVRELTSSWPELLNFFDVEKCNRYLIDWKDHAAVHQGFLENIVERDFLKLGCTRQSAGAGSEAAR